jgi:hypothetical protein
MYSVFRADQIIVREHNMIRFSDGVPQAIWYSQHASGQAFTYGATERKGKRPIGYVGNGTHAVYAIPGYVSPSDIRSWKI